MQASNTSPPWSSVAPFLDQVLDLQSDERESFLTDLATTQPAIAQVVRDMLARHALLNAQGFLSQPPIDALRSSHTGERVGNYTLVELVGRGGMGEVWRASRTDGRFEGYCAIKFLNAFASPKLEDRFRREGQVLARLTHPNVARLMDAGATESGAPYLVLEYIEGVRIDRYCTDKNLSIDERVRLFVDVVAAVAHAHSQLVIHRDIKPSNVLVTGQGQVKLLDFGIAKLLGDEQTNDGLTRLEDAALTPEFAAPEQMLGEMPSTATDVYQLGMLLYVLLTGVHPFEQSVTRAERIRNALDGVVPPASELAEASNRKQLRGDLDAILAKALRKIPAERFATAQSLNDELHRYLDHEPVEARRGAAWYRAKKFVRRHRVPVLAGLILVSGLAIGLIAVNNERVIAERRFDQLKTLAEQIFELDKSIRTLPGSTEARQKLVAVSLDYLSGLAKDVNGDIDLAATVGSAYWRVGRVQGVPVENNLGDFVKAEKSLVEAERLIDIVYAARPEDPRIQSLSASIAHDRMILAESEQRRADALLHASKALERFDQYFLGPMTDEQHDGALRNYLNIALAYTNLGHYGDAMRVLDRAMEIDKGAKDSAATTRKSVALSMVANVRRLQGDLPQALAAIEEARRIAEDSSFGSSDQRMAYWYSLLMRHAMILGEDGGISLGRSQEAIAVYQQAFDVTDEASKSNAKDYSSRSRFISAARDLGNIVRHTDPEKALGIYDAALARVREIPDTPSNRRIQAQLLANSSYALRSLHRNDAAQQRIAAALALLERNKDLPAQRISLDDTLFGVLCASADATGERDPQKAVDVYREILNKLSFEIPNPNPHEDLRAAFKLARAYRGIGAAYSRIGTSAEAEEIRSRHQKLVDEWRPKLSDRALLARLGDATVPAPP